MASAAKSKQVIRNLATFNAKHDRQTVIRNSINRAIAELLEEGEEYWEYEVDQEVPSGGFLKRCGISQADMSMCRNEFLDYQHEARAPNSRSSNIRRIWFASKSVATRARGGKPNGKAKP
jgi:hypothetical protein